jgi:hypothetical protein
MTKQITRYSIGVTLDEDLSIDADENGEWVKYDDVKRLLQHEMTVEEVMRATREPSQEDWAAAKAAVEPRGDVSVLTTQRREIAGTAEPLACPLCGRTDTHSHTAGPLGMS